MTSITYDHGYLNDCDATGTKGQSGIDAGDAVQAILYGDVLDISGVWDNVGAEYVTITYDFTNISSDVYTHYLIRWRTEDVASPGAGAQAYLTFTAGTQDLLEATGIPQFDTNWHVTTGTITPAKTIDNVIFVANDYPDSYGNGVSDTKHVYYDFLLLCKGPFTLPNVTSCQWSPNPRDVTRELPTRVTDLIQPMGSKNATATLECDLDFGTWTTTGYTDYAGQVFDGIAHKSSTEPWQWVSGLDGLSFKARVKSARDYARGKRLTLDLTEYSLGDKASESAPERWGST